MVSPQATPKSAGTKAATAGRVLYVDSRLGSDTYTGTALTVSGNIGPWKTLAMVAATALQAGDEVRLVCGSTWNETLRVNASGLPAAPIKVSAYPNGCASRPTIDGGAAIAATAWSLHKGSIYKTSLASQPVMVTATTGYLEPAHFPTRGFDGTNPTSPYLRTAADSAVVTAGTRTGSTYLITGADLQLPAGASITSNTKVRVRVNSWTLDERSVSSVSGNRLNLSSVTSYPITAGWGYFLLGELWMLDNPGEYHYDTASRTLYAWMPNSSAPLASVSASSLVLGVDLQTRANVTIDGVSIRRVGVGVNMRNTTGVTLSNLRIDQTNGFGIDAGASTDATIVSSAITNSGSDAISGIDDYSAATSGLRVLNNQISSSGVIVSGSTPVSLPQRSRAAIRGGLRSVVTGNRVIDSGFMGIWAMEGSTVSGNWVSGACSVLDDCGGIYTSGQGNNGKIINNVVVYSRGAPNGKAGTLDNVTQAQGIYLDEYASGVEVSGNTVAYNNDNGIKLHVASNNIIKSNKLYGNRRSQVQMHADKNKVQIAGDVYGNTVSSNQVATTDSSARGISLETEYANTDKFGVFDFNKYLDRVYPTIGTDVAGGVRRDMTLPLWKSALDSNGQPRNLDPNGSGVSQTTFAGSRIAGATILNNGDLSKGTSGWTVWNETVPLGTLTVSPCSIGQCGQFSSGTSIALLSSPRFSVTQGQWYRMTVDLRVGVPNQKLEMVVRRGGGGTNGFEPVTSVGYLYPAATTAWQRFSYVFQATKTVIANDPKTGDYGARFDVQNIQASQTLGIANLEIVPITAASASTTTDLLLNSSSVAATQIACPVAATNQAACSNYVRLTDDTPVTWPYYLPALSSEIVYTRDATLIDSDIDGIPDTQDSCAATPAGAAVNARGCAIGQ